MQIPLYPPPLSFWPLSLCVALHLLCVYSHVRGCLSVVWSCLPWPSNASLCSGGSGGGRPPFLRVSNPLTSSYHSLLPDHLAPPRSINCVPPSCFSDNAISSCRLLFTLSKTPEWHHKHPHTHSRPPPFLPPSNPTHTLPSPFTHTYRSCDPSGKAAPSR